jgi:hypothetical protein
MIIIIQCKNDKMNSFIKKKEGIDLIIKKNNFHYNFHYFSLFSFFHIFYYFCINILSVLIEEKMREREQVIEIMMFF